MLLKTFSDPWATVFGAFLNLQKILSFQDFLGQTTLTWCEQLWHPHPIEITLLFHKCSKWCRNNKIKPVNLHVHGILCNKSLCPQYLFKECAQVMETVCCCYQGSSSRSLVDPADEKFTCLTLGNSHTMSL